MASKDDEAHRPIVSKFILDLKTDHGSAAVKQRSNILGRPSTAGGIELIGLVEEFNGSCGPGWVFPCYFEQADLYGQSTQGIPPEEFSSALVLSLPDA